MIIEFIPSVCETKEDGLAPSWAGSVSLRLPTFNEKYEYLEECDPGDEESRKAHFRTIRKMVDCSQKHIEKVAIKRLSDNKEFKTFEELQDDDSTHSILIEIASRILHGAK